MEKDKIPLEQIGRRSDRNQSGSALLSSIIGALVISVLILSYAGIYTSTQKARVTINLLNLISQVQLTLRNTANDANSWVVTISDTTHNPAMSCLVSNSCTTPIAATPLVLWPAGTPGYSNLADAVYDGTNPTAGFTSSGTACTTFSMSGNPDCPLHINLTWSTPGCSPAPCQAPVTIAADIVYRPGPNAIPLNDTALGITFISTASTNFIPCVGSAPAAEAALCATPPYPQDQLICTSTGFRCGRVYY